jgi:hypothetical protein
MNLPPNTPPAALAWSRRLIRILVVLNLAYAAGVMVMFLMSITPGTILWNAIGIEFPAGHRERIVFGLRAIMIVGIAAAGVVDRVLRHLLAIVETVRAGDPFVSANARRLEAIAWGVLAGEGLRLLIGAIALATTSALPALDLDLHFSFAPWLTVLLLFVLARVFAEGARMRSDLEGTV